LNQMLIHRLIRSDKINQAGRLFVVVGRYTFSAGMMLAAEIERHTDAVFVGEPTASSANSAGQDVGIRFSLQWNARQPFRPIKTPAVRISAYRFHRSSTHRHHLHCSVPIVILRWKRSSSIDGPGDP
jgi:hypothetical protein